MKIENPYKNPEDKLLFAKILDKYTAAQKNHRLAHSDFLDPVRCASFVQTLERANDGVFMLAYGGYEDAERKIISFDTREIEHENFPITPIAVTYNRQFSKAPTHRDYLGAVLGLGLDRGKIGDICLGAEGAVMYVSEDVANFITETLDQVGRVSVKVKTRQQLGGPVATGVTKRITVPSMRLDAVLSSALNLSRGKAATLIESEKVFVNWKPAKKTHIVAVGDAITVRGLGRIAIDAQGGSTKKDRVVLEVTVNK
ncbi:MAG: YlmH/Sll1252 family protein [Firmicutes bacterium]|nr:YlmH/Sll1252 family protein [Bacillota bacterium]